MFTWKSRLDARAQARRNGESGLALLDVLLGMAIFALIAVIAAQAQGHMRKRAHVTAATSDVKRFAAVLHGHMTQPNATLPADSMDLMMSGLLFSPHFTFTQNVSISGYATDGKDYALCFNYATDAWALYRSKTSTLATGIASGTIPASCYSPTL